MKVKHKKIVASFSTEAESIALLEVCEDAIYWNNFISEINKDTFENILGNFLCDNQSFGKYPYNPKYHKRCKYVDFCHHFVRECINNKIVVLPKPNKVNQFFVIKIDGAKFW